MIENLIITNDKHYQNIAEMIRFKTGSLNTFTPSEMADAIKNIEGGGGKPSYPVKIVINNTFSEIISCDHSISEILEKQKTGYQIDAKFETELMPDKIFNLTLIYLEDDGIIFGSVIPDIKNQDLSLNAVISLLGEQDIETNNEYWSVVYSPVSGGSDSETDDSILTKMVECGLTSPIVDNDDVIFTDSNNNIFII